VDLTIPRLVIAAAQSGTGKTTVATGLMAALARRGLRVQPYKVGPDYIDPTYHTAATGRTSRNLDGWMFDEEAVRRLVAGSAQGADLALIEGVMGLFDGAGATTEAGSTAQIARWLAAPVLLVVDARGIARTAAALIQGLCGFDPTLRIAGVVFNNVGSESHYRLLYDALQAYVPAVKPVGYLPREAAIRAPERHLGLVPSYERDQTAAYLDSLVSVIGRTVDLDGVLKLARSCGPLLVPPDDPLPAVTAGQSVRIGLARDAAFHFYYEDGLDLLRRLGAELVPFSPLCDESLPPDLDALYLGGGFPEVYRQALAEHALLRRAVRAALDAGTPVYAECGGLMYLSEAIVDAGGAEWPMVGAIPVKARMQPRLNSLGYVTAEAQAETLLAAPGEVLRGHEFHWSQVDEHPAGWAPAYRTTSRRGGTRLEGFYGPNLLASYVHVHFSANPRAAARFVEAARGYRRTKTGGE
jgi:cobyrinic acid a,c-diamide synthase